MTQLFDAAAASDMQKEAALGRTKEAATAALLLSPRKRCRNREKGRNGHRTQLSPLVMGARARGRRKQASKQAACARAADADKFPLATLASSLTVQKRQSKKTER